MIRDHELPESRAPTPPRRLALLALLLAAASPAAAQGPSIVDGFETTVTAFQVDHALLPDGGMVLAGDLMVIDGVTRGRLVRLLPDGSYDASFDPAPDDLVDAVVVQPDGKILVGGDFATIAGQPRGHLARLHPDGSLDTSFQPEVVATTFSVQVVDLALQPDGKLLVAGVFDSLAGVPAEGLGRLLPDGSFDPAFAAPADLQKIRAVEVQPDGRILVGGSFAFPTTLPDLARLHPDGSVDTSFSAPAVGSVEAIALLPDRRIVVAGDLVNASGGQLARFAPDGTPDATLEPVFDGALHSVEIQADGRILAGGPFTEVDGVERAGTARFLPDGTLDPSFVPTFRHHGRNSPTSISEQGDGMILLSGNGGTRRLHADGTYDETLVTGVDSFVFGLAVQPDGRLVVAGAYSTLAGTPRIGLGRLLPDGHLDADFTPSVNTPTMTNERAFSVLVQPDGKIVVGGSFDDGTDFARNNLVRLASDGSLDGDFVPLGADGSVQALALEPDGSVLVGGGSSQVGAANPGRLARVLPDGSVNPFFNPGPNDDVQALAVQPDGKIVVGGSFSVISGMLRQHLSRIFASEASDAGFDPFPHDEVRALALQPDGKILVGGLFRTIAGVERDVVARLNADGTLDESFDAGAIAPASARVLALAVQTDGKVLVGGAFSNIQGLTRWSVARLHPDGSLDQDFDLGFLDGLSAPGQVLGFAPQPNGEIVVSGFFTAVDGAERDSLMRLREPTPPVSRLAADGGGVTWFRDGGLEIDRADLQWSADGIAWSDLGAMTRIGTTSDWRLDMVVPVGVPVWFRARGYHGPSNSQLVAGRMHWIPPDGDGDGMSDEHELRYGLDPDDAGDASLDDDGDGLSSLEELLLHPWLDPTDPDTDGDGLDDGLDPAPLRAGDDCTGGTAADATFAAAVSGAAHCFASGSIAVESPAAVDAGGELLLVAPRIVFGSGFRAAGRLRVVSSHPCAACS